MAKRAIPWDTGDYVSRKNPSRSHGTISAPSSASSKPLVSPTPEDAFASEEAYAMYRAAEDAAEKTESVSINTKRDEGATFELFHRLPNELKLNVLTYFEGFDRATPVQIRDYLFALSDLSFMPSVGDIARLRFSIEAQHFPYHYYQAVESLWFTHRDGHWPPQIRFRGGCKDPAFRSYPQIRCDCPRCTEIYAPLHRPSRWLHYLNVHQRYIQSIASFLTSELEITVPDMTGVLCRIWPYLPTENSIGPQTRPRRQRQLEYLATLTQIQRNELDAFLNTLCNTIPAPSYGRIFQSEPTRSGFGEVGRWLRKPELSTHGVRLHWEILKLCFKHLLLSCPLMFWACLFHSKYWGIWQSLDLEEWLPSVRDQHPRSPLYEVEGREGIVEVACPVHVHNWYLYDSLGIWKAAITLPEGRVLDLDEWRESCEVNGPEKHVFR